MTNLKQQTFEQWTTERVNLKLNKNVHEQMTNSEKDKSEHDNSKKETTEKGQTWKGNTEQIVLMNKWV